MSQHPSFHTDRSSVSVPMAPTTTMITVGCGPVIFPFSAEVISVLTAIMLVAIVIDALRMDLARQLIPAPLPALAIAFLLCLAGLSTIWSIDPARSLDRTVKLAPIALCAAVALSPAARMILAPHRARILRVMAWGCGVGAALAAADMLAGYPIQALGRDLFGGDDVKTSFYNRGLTFILMLSLPAIAWLVAMSQPRLAIALTAVVILAAALSVNNVMKLGLITGAIVALAAWRTPKLTAYTLAGGTTLLAFLQPVLYYQIADRIAYFEWQRHSIYNRIEIWDYVALAAIRKPLTGWGLDVTRYLPTFHERVDAYDIVSRLYMHGHNNFLEIWSNIGVLGVAAAVALVWMAINGIRRLDHTAIRAFLLAGLAIVILVAFVSFGAWQTSWLAALVLVTVIYRLCADYAPSSAS